MKFNRHITSELLIWKESPRRKPLVLRGARQVGKTTLIREFSENYIHFIELNLERTRDAQYFSDFDDAKTLIKALFAAHSIPQEQISDTLLFIDEIQESPDAIALLRYFKEDLPSLHVIAAGSLLEQVMSAVKKIPVGRIEYLYLHPLNFEEYLDAKGHTGAMSELEKVPLENYAHSLLKREFHEYAIIGGMPEVVKTFLETEGLSNISRVYESIWETYKNDVEKYARNASDARVIKHIMQTAHLYLDQRVKFQKFGKSNYRSREVGEAMRNLNDARIIQLIYPTTGTNPPIQPAINKSPRLQFLDTGLVNYELNIQAEMLAMKDFNTAFKGAIIPHLITQELISLTTTKYKQPNFWVRDKKQSSAEVDLVLNFDNKVIPIEVKSGKQGKLKSLHQFIEQADHPYAIRMYAGSCSVEQHQTPGTKKPYLLMNLPYYLGTKLPEYLQYFTSEYSLNNS